MARPVNPAVEDRFAICGLAAHLRRLDTADPVTRLTAALTMLGSAVFLSGCGGGDGTPAGPSDESMSRPSQIVVSPTIDTLSWISATQQLSATVLNSSGTTLSTTVTWTSSAPSVASVASSGLVTAVGQGTTSITAQAGTATGAATIVVQQLPSTITKVSGDNQTATVGELLPSPLVVELKDQGGSVVQGATLIWNVTQGGGTLESSSGETDGSGRGQTTWRLGSEEGNQSLQVSASGLTPVEFTALTVGPASPVTITAVSPDVLIEGSPATVMGSGFSSDPAANTVLIGGLEAVVTASSTDLTP